MKNLTSNKEFLIAASPLLLIIFIDSMGLGLVFPLLNAIIIDPVSNFLPHDFSAHIRNLIFGFTISIFMLAWFFGASFLGDLSDQIGRKKSLLICLWGAFFGYLLSAAGVSLQSYTLLLLGRVIAGFTAGSQAIAQASIIDLSPPEQKARNLGLMFLASSLGFVVGPLMGGFLSDAKLSHWFTFATPFYFAALIALLNVALLKRLYQETFHKVGKIKIKFSHAIELFVSAFRDEKIRYLSIVLLIVVFGWSSFYSFISMFLLRVYQFSPVQISIYMALMGIGFSIGNLIIGPCVQRFSLKNCVIGGLLLGAIITFFIVTLHMVFLNWIMAILISIAMSIAYAVLLNIFSNQVDADSQGWIMGVTGSIMALVYGINALFVGMLADFSAKMPLIISILGFSISALFMVFFQSTKQVTQSSSYQPH